MKPDNYYNIDSKDYKSIKKAIKKIFPFYLNGFERGWLKIEEKKRDGINVYFIFTQLKNGEYKQLMEVWI